MPPWGRKVSSAQPADHRHSFPPITVDIVDVLLRHEVNRLAGRQLPVDSFEEQFDQEPGVIEKIAAFCRWATGKFRHVDCTGYDRYPF